MKFKIPGTYAELVNKATRIQHVTRYFSGNRDTQVNPVSQQAPSSLFFIFDFTHGSYLYVDSCYKNMLGAANKKGSDEFARHIHPNDLRIMNEKMIPEVNDFFKSQKNEQLVNFSISMNYRLQSVDGTYRSVMQRSNRILTSDTGKEMAVTGFIIDISSFKEDSKMVLTIEKRKNTFSFSPAPVHRSVYFPDARNGVLSQREMEILQGIGMGLCSKEIAKKLFISAYTVNNHRKKMLRKSGCNNTSELLKLVMSQGEMV